jgi:uncharacterized membrane protein HdeD (DUF308 family)
MANPQRLAISLLAMCICIAVIVAILQAFSMRWGEGWSKVISFGLFGLVCWAIWAVTAPRAPTSK